tara:strand:- start:28 stop:822 length:795 start_codon:yes stop_codon:yes gene_type:complete
MFISNKVCFLELEKTGISSIKKYLKHHISDGVITRPHDYVTEDILQQKILFLGSIRNPLDWYISRWSYGCMMKNDDSLFKNFVNKRLNLNRINAIEGQLSNKIKYLKNQIFKKNKYIENLYSDPFNKNNFRLWLKELLTMGKKSSLAEHYFFTSLNKNFGYMTYRYLIMFTNPKHRREIYFKLNNLNDIKEFDKRYVFINNFVKIENLKDDLKKVIDKLNINEKVDIETVNPSKRNRELNYYYDNETINIVKNYDKFLFEKFNY